MSQWGQQGYQYPMQTGFNPQLQQGFPQGGLGPQSTGFPGQRPGFLQSQPTGFPGPQGFQQPQQTGFQGPGSNYQQQQQQQQRLPIPPVPPLPIQFQQNSSFLGQPQQQQAPSRFAPLSSIQSQPTGYVGASGFGRGVPPPAAPLMPQMTGYIDPRLQMMSSTFMPVNPAAPYNAGGLPQLPPQPQQMGAPSLQHSIQQLNQETRGTAAPKMPWTLSKAEKKSYDQMFRTWDAQGTGFIDGQTAREIFGQSGLDNNDLARIWTLADADNRGKLNLQEFHVAMGLIFRRLNGNEVPDELPAELVPPSHRDLDDSVNFLKGVLKNETRVRSPSALDVPVSRLKERSLTGSSAPGAGGRQDATVYRHQDTDMGGFYQPRSRHLDRSAVRVGNESPADDLSDIKRQLDNTAKMLDRAAEESASKTAEDEALERELSDLKYRVKRVQEDLDYASRGPRSQAKDEERRRLERELLKLMHERVPEVERKMKDREERKEREKREWARDRDRRNDRHGRYDDREDSYSSSRRYEDEDRERGSYRSSYDRDDRVRERSRDREYDRDRSRRREPSYERDRDRDRGYERPRSPPAARSPPPPPPPAAAPSTLSKPPPPAPTASPAPAIKNMTPEQRKEYIRAEAERRKQERMAALGLLPPGGSRSLDMSVTDRLAAEKKEAEEKSKEAERLAEERERLRRERLDNEKALTDGRGATPQPTPTASVPPTPVETPTQKPAPPAPKRAPAPPPPRKAPAPRPQVTPRISAPTPPAPSRSFASPAPPPPPPVPSTPQIDPEEQRLKEREEALRKQREERLERIRQLEKEEEDARMAEEQYQSRRRAFLDSSSPASPPPASSYAAPMVKSPPEPEPQQQAAPSPAPPPPPPPPPPAPPAVSSPPVAAPGTGTNPFSRMMKDGAGASPTPPAANGMNPFFRSQTAPPPAAPSPASPVGPPPKSSTPVPVKTTYHTAPRESDDDWDEVEEKDEDDSSDDELATSRQSRSALAQELFGSILPPARPQSAGPATPKTAAAAQPPSAPPAPAPPSAPAPPPPPPPSAPAAPPPPTTSAPAAAAGDRGALLSAIAGGARLRKAVTNDRSSAPVSGKVLGDAAPPQHINAAPRPASPPSTSSAPPPPPADAPPFTMPTMSSMDSSSSNRQSVDWYAGLAADQGGGAYHDQLPPTAEEDEYEVIGPSNTVPDIQVSEHGGEANDIMEDVDKTINYRVRSLYAYEGQRPEDLSFGENLVLTAHPSKSGGEWWYGTVVRDGRSGFFPKTYVQVLENVIKAKALYPYTGGGSDELPLAEGDEVVVVDRSEPDWWKAEEGGVIFIVPAAYLEAIDDALTPGSANDEGMAASGTETRDPSLDVTEVDDDCSDDGNSTDDDSDSEYLSFSDSESESDKTRTEEARKREREARENERRRVLEAAGLVVKADTQTSSKPSRSRSLRRRPPPAVPQRSSVISDASDKDLPVLPPPDADDNAIRLDDAYERYEAFQKTSGHTSRLSASSIETGPPSPSLLPPHSPTSSLARTVSRDSEGGRTYSNLFNFLGRRTPANDAEKRTMPIISAPILSRPSTPSTPTQQNGSPSFGSSWSSLVDKTALDEIPATERRRQEAIFELITTETSYVRDLQLIVEVFYSSLLPLLDQKAITVIFANVEDILLIDTTFLSSLEERQKECRLYIDRIGDILEINMSKMGVYMDYCVNQGTAIKVLQSLRETNPDLAAHLQRLRDDPAVRNLDLSSYLLAPMQRVTRYPLLIRQILHYTEMAEDRERCEHALEIAESILANINESIREQEGRERLRSISRDLWIGQGHLDLTAPTRYMGPRRLVKEGLLAKAKSGRKLRGFLCSDIFVLTDEAAKTLYRMPIPLSELQVQDVPGGRDDSAFRLALPYPRGGDTINLRAMSVRDCQVWVQAIEAACGRYRQAEKRVLRKK